MTFPRRQATAAVASCIALAAACDFFDPLSQPGLRLLVDPPDTAVYVGARFQARGLMRNSFNDLYPTEHVRFTALDPAISASLDGAVAGVAFGRARLLGWREHLVDTGVGERGAAGDPGGQHLLRAVGDRDRGSGRLGVHHARRDGPDQRRGAVVAARQRGDRLPVRDPGRRRRDADLRHRPRSRLLVASGVHPRASRDGSWVYYVAGADLWRVRLDGSGTEQLTSANPFYPYTHPDPSPDGTRLAASRKRVPDDGTFEVIVWDLATATEQPLGVLGFYPRWAPDGTRIAYWSGLAFGSAGAIAVVNADGSGARQVSAEGRIYRNDAIDWSPDANGCSPGPTPPWT